MHIRSLPFAGMLIMLPGLAAPSPGAPQGRYCGKLFSAGEIVAAETTFEFDQGGRIAGRYQFRDGDVVTDGRLEEASKETPSTRLLIWHDRYGKGQLTVTFGREFESFDGYWGSDAPVPGHIWTGERCQEPIT
jgi:hypothetical protein